MRDPRIVAQTPDPRFAQQNPRMVRIQPLRITYPCVRTCDVQYTALVHEHVQTIVCNLRQTFVRGPVHSQHDESRVHVSTTVMSPGFLGLYKGCMYVTGCKNRGCKSKKGDTKVYRRVTVQTRAHQVRRQLTRRRKYTVSSSWTWRWEIGL